MTAPDKFAQKREELFKGPEKSRKYLCPRIDLTTPTSPHHEWSEYISGILERTFLKKS